MRLCSIPDCERPHDAKGLCKMHSKRKERGLPLDNSPIPTRAKKGDIMSFVSSVVMRSDDRETCLPWPFGRTNGGYGQSRYVCELQNGPPPSTAHQASHSCGKGNEGCVNRFHLRWKLPSDNCLEKVEHGTIVRGGSMHSAILTEDKVLIIKEMRGKLSIARLAKVFDVGHSTVQQIQSGKKWGWVSPHRE